MMEDAAGLDFAKDRTSKAGMVEYLTALEGAWDMVHFTAERFVSEDDQIAVFGYCAWRNKATGKTAQARFGHLWRFQNEKAVEFVEIFDSARAAKAATA